MSLLRLRPEPTTPLPEPAEALRSALVELYRPRRRRLVRSNLVLSAEGSMIGPDGRAGTLSTPLDQQLMGVIRAHADLVLVGAETVRREGYPMPPTASLAIVTATGRLDGHRLSSGGPGRLLVIAPAEAHDTVRAGVGGRAVELLALPEHPHGSLPARWMIDALRDAGFDQIVNEAGPRLSTPLHEQGIIDELCLTQVTVRSSRMLAPPFSAATLPEPHLLLRDETDGTRFSLREL